jgi:flagellar hook-associated protein 1 FlgK
MLSLNGMVILARNAMQSQQAAIQTTEHNIANANTPGFARQEPVLTTATTVTATTVVGGGAPVQLGTGVQLNAIKSNRDKFLDSRIRRALQDLGSIEKQGDNVKLVEITFNELAEGIDIHNSLMEFWNAWETLAQDPTDLSYRVQVKQKAHALAGDLRYLYQRLQDMFPDLDEALRSEVLMLNSKARSIADLNEGIVALKATGAEPNDLYDRRNLLIEELAKISDITVTEMPNGSVNITIGGVPIVQGVQSFDLITTPSQPGVPSDVRSSLDNSPVEFKSGEIHGILEFRDRILPDILRGLDELSTSLVREVNRVHRAGYGLDGSTGLPFFSLEDDPDPRIDPDAVYVNGITSKLKLSDEIEGDLLKIAAAGQDAPANNENALRLVQLREEKLLSSGQLTYETFYNTLVAEIGRRADEISRKRDNLQVVLDQLINRRESISGVSIDEELTNMIRYQNVYEAAARLVTTIDEMMDVVVNRMGLVGR